MDDFYEDDEPIEDVLRAFREGERGVTRGSKRPDPEALRRAWAAADRIDLSSLTFRDNTFEGA